MAAKAQIAGGDERRKKILLVAASAVLLLVFAVQAPRFIKMIRGTSASAATPSGETSPATPRATPAAHPDTIQGERASGAAFRRRLHALGLRSKDPFAQPHVGGARGVSSAKGTGEPGVALKGATKRSTSKPHSGRSDWPRNRTAYTVVLSTIPVRYGRSRAARAKLAFRKHGFRHAGVLTSSDYRGLRPGYYVVFSGVDRSSKAANARAGRLRAHGLKAYARRISASS